jgi:ParB-like nuclease family protein
MTKMTDRVDVRAEFAGFVAAAFAADDDLGELVEDILVEGIDHPLGEEEAAQLLSRAVDALKQACAKVGDDNGRRQLGTEGLVQQMIAARRQLRQGSGARQARSKIKLQDRDGVTAGPYRPTPYFRGRSIPVNGGYVRLDDIRLWERNARLELYIQQFEQTHRRRPNHAELVQIMTRQLRLPGSPKEDEFEIQQLARNIAENGLQRPPILSFSDELLDGNRRVAACHLIRESDQFTPDQKRRVEYVYALQLTEHANTDDENALVVALNFEDDCKRRWPEFVKARHVWNLWEELKALSPGTPDRERRRQLAQSFGLEQKDVTRYLKMMEVANEFEEYLVSERGLDAHQVNHSTNTYFQYFDELQKGAGPGGVRHTLDQNEELKRLVFDLLHQGKFVNWTLIRHLKYFDNEMHKALAASAAEQEVGVARDEVERILNAAHDNAKDQRQTGANKRISEFVKWLEGLPVSAFRDMVERENLEALLGALRLVEGNVKDALNV